ncbi:hypothetical protein G4B88_014274 [Cannabis sativa]|uniref:Homeobox domain-containing protein n=1 Tax=Cannabis sativa TaxID=3483 RepID=A0A7J6I9U1_CANSA|nr:hypothetical protein G4B88_014274 [Cannabis sativa]
MGLASALYTPLLGLHSASLLGGDHLLSSQLRRIPPGHLIIGPNPHRRSISTLTLARRRNRNSTPATSSSLTKKNNKKKLGRNVDEDEIDEDAIEALFAQLEEDLKKADPSLFEEPFGSDHERDTHISHTHTNTIALEFLIKSLAAELCLDRAVVLEMLREPPPSLLMMAATLPDDEPTGPIITVTDTKTIEEAVVEETPKLETSAKVPVHVKQQRLSSQKRIKKVDIQTLENVYRRSKRPTNTMIDSIVHVTNLPRKRIVKWFEDKRAEEGVPGQRLPYQRSAPDTIP